MVDSLEADCPAPWPAHRFAMATFNSPANSCDTHAHIIARDPAYPLSADRSYTPPAAFGGWTLDAFDFMVMTFIISTLMRVLDVSQGEAGLLSTVIC